MHPITPGAVRRQIEISLRSKCSPDFVCVFNLSPSLTFWSSSHRDGKEKKDMKLPYLNEICKGNGSLQAPQKSLRNVNIRQLAVQQLETCNKCSDHSNGSDEETPPWWCSGSAEKQKDLYAFINWQTCKMQMQCVKAAAESLPVCFQRAAY